MATVPLKRGYALGPFRGAVVASPGRLIFRVVSGWTEPEDPDFLGLEPEFPLEEPQEPASSPSSPTGTPIPSPAKASRVGSLLELDPSKPRRAASTPVPDSYWRRATVHRSSLGWATSDSLPPPASRWSPFGPLAARPGAAPARGRIPASGPNAATLLHTPAPVRDLALSRKPSAPASADSEGQPKGGSFGVAAAVASRSGAYLQLPPAPGPRAGLLAEPRAGPRGLHPAPDDGSELPPSTWVRPPKVVDRVVFAWSGPSEDWTRSGAVRFEASPAEEPSAEVLTEPTLVSELEPDEPVAPEVEPLPVPSLPKAPFAPAGRLFDLVGLLGRAWWSPRPRVAAAVASASEPAGPELAPAPDAITATEPPSLTPPSAALGQPGASMQPAIVPRVWGRSGARALSELVERLARSWNLGAEPVARGDVRVPVSTTPAYAPPRPALVPSSPAAAPSVAPDVLPVIAPVQSLPQSPVAPEPPRVREPAPVAPPSPVRNRRETRGERPEILPGERLPHSWRVPSCYHADLRPRRSQDRCRRPRTRV